MTVVATEEAAPARYSSDSSTRSYSSTSSTTSSYSSTSSGKGDGGKGGAPRRFERPSERRARLEAEGGGSECLFRSIGDSDRMLVCLCYLLKISV